MKTDKELKQAIFDHVYDAGMILLDSEQEHLISLCAPIIARRILEECAVHNDTELIDLTRLKAAVEKLAQQ